MIGKNRYISTLNDVVEVIEASKNGQQFRIIRVVCVLARPHFPAEKPDGASSATLRLAEYAAYAAPFCVCTNARVDKQLKWFIMIRES